MLLISRDKGGQADFDFYPYNPNAIAAWIFVVLFAIGSAVHIAFIIPYRSWFFIPFVLGCIAETGGYYGRAWAHNNRRLGSPYLLQLFLLIGAVPFMSATIYMTLSRIARALGAAEHSIVRISWISKIYVLIDIACFVLQVMGTVTQAYGGAEKQDTAKHLVIGGLTFQLVAFVFFMFLAWMIHRRLGREPISTENVPGIHWRRYFCALYITSALVLLRNLVRIVEFEQGAVGTIASSQAYLFIFDAVPMALVVLVMAVFYPGRLIKASRRNSKQSRHSLDMPLVQDDACHRVT